MINYFDVATPEEVEEFYGYVPTAEEIAEARDALTRDLDANAAHLAYLFADRGDYAQASLYLDQIQDDLTLADTGRMLGHDSAYLEWCQTHPSR